MMRISGLLFGLSAMALLSGCMGGASPMARGYSSYDQVYKSAPGKEASNVGYEYSKDINDSNIQDLGYAAQELAEKLDKKISFSAEELYLNIPKNTAFYNSFDHVLRDALTHRGYILSLTPEDALKVDVVAKDIDHNSCGLAAKGKILAQIALVIEASKDMPFDYVSGLYEIAPYGFTSAGVVDTPMPECAMEEIEK